MSHLHQIGGFQVCKSLTSHYQTIAGLLRHECMRHSLYCIDPLVSQTACKVTGGGGSVIHIAVTPQTSWTQPRPVIRVSEIIGACVHSIYNSAADSGEVTADCWEEQPWLTFPGSPPKLSSRRKGLCNIRIPCWKHLLALSHLRIYWDTMVNGRLNQTLSVHLKLGHLSLVSKINHWQKASWWIFANQTI